MSHSLNDQPIADERVINMEQRISMMTLGVSDLARSRQFFEAGLGWQPSRGSNEQIVFFQVGGLGGVRA